MKRPVRRRQLWTVDLSPAIVQPAEQWTGTPDQARFSVVIPCYNYAHYLREAVESALAQEGVGVEVIIVDDCSTDNGREVAREFAATDPRVRTIFHEVNRGHLRTYNDGLAAADGDFVVLLSADDRLAPGAFSRAAALFSAYPEVGLVYGGFVEAFGDQPVTLRSGPVSWSVWRGRDWIWDRCRIGRNPLRSPEAIVRATVLDKVGRDYRDELPHSGDLEMWMRVATVSDVGYIRGADQAIYRLHEGNMHRALFEAGEETLMLGDVRQRLAAFEMTFAEAGRSLPKRFRRVARRTFAKQALRYLTRRLMYVTEPDTESSRQILEFARGVCPPWQVWPWWLALRFRERLDADQVRGSRVIRQLETIQFKRDALRRRRWKRLGI